MYITKIKPAVIIISLLGTVGLWILGSVQIPAGRNSRYGMLVTGENIPDREIRRRLEGGGLSGLISESGQWFLLDCFGSVEQIPLDEFGTRLLSFDPRNDGYAEKLRSLFVHDGRRVVYIPLGFPAQAHKKIAAALEDIPYSLEYGRRRIPPGLLLLLFCLAAGAFFVIRPLRLALRHEAGSLLPCLPLLSPLLLGGAAGFALAALLAGLAVYLAGPGHGQKRWLLPSIFLASYFLVVFLAGIPVLFSLSVPALLACVLALPLRNMSHKTGSHSMHRVNRSISRVSGGVYRMSQRSGGTSARTPARGKKLRSFSRRDMGHRRFSPVSIMGRQRTVDIDFSRAMIPFAVASLILAIINIALPDIPVEEPSFVPPVNVVSEGDYQDHVLFQSTFSLRALHTPAASGNRAVPAGMVDYRKSTSGGRYRLASDGLPELVPDEDFENENFSRLFKQGSVPPFPLGRLLQELGRKGSSGVTGRVPDIFLVLVPLLFIIPWLIVREVSMPRPLGRIKGMGR